MWLHWSEYLLAQDEFYRWFQKMVVTLEPPVELQLGLKEKQWQLSHAQVLLHNVDNQAVLLDRLLEEAGSLFSRIGDPSVDEEAQKRMKAEYDAVKARAQVSGNGSIIQTPTHPVRPFSLCCSLMEGQSIRNHFPLNLLACLLPSLRHKQTSSVYTLHLSNPPAHSFISLAFPNDLPLSRPPAHPLAHPAILSSANHVHLLSHPPPSNAHLHPHPSSIWLPIQQPPVPYISWSGLELHTHTCMLNTCAQTDGLCCSCPRRFSFSLYPSPSHSMFFFY